MGQVVPGKSSCAAGREAARLHPGHEDIDCGHCRGLTMIQEQPSVTQSAAADNFQPTQLYVRLKSMASCQRRRGGTPNTLCTTEIVHETFLRMSGANYRSGEIAQFFAYAARTMRHILVDAARRRSLRKHGGNQTRVDVSDTAMDDVHIDPQPALELDDALIALARE